MAIFFLLKKISRKMRLSYARSAHILNFVLLVLFVLSLIVNQIIITKTNRLLGLKGNIFAQFAGAVFNKTFSSNGVELDGDLGQDVVKLVISRGAPGIYGQELGVSFDSAEQSINIMRQFDPDYGTQKIVLTGDDLRRYIDVGLKIACEYCCGAKALVFEDGRAACGCAHSIAMRGLLAYLIKNHGTEYTNDELLREMARWKGVYFPKQMMKKMAEGLQNGDFAPDIAALVLGLKLPDYGSGKEAPLPSEIQNLPNMVGGC